MPRRSRKYLELAFEQASRFNNRYDAISAAGSVAPIGGSHAAADFRDPLGAHVGDNAVAFLAVACDYISAWRRLFVESRYQPIYAHGGLIRGRSRAP